MSLVVSEDGDSFGMVLRTSLANLFYPRLKLSNPLLVSVEVFFCFKLNVSLSTWVHPIDNDVQTMSDISAIIDELVLTHTIIAFIFLFFIFTLGHPE